MADLRAIIEPVVAAMGYELVWVEFHSSGRNGLLRVYIDHPDGITVDDCSRVSHQVSGLLDVEDPIPGHYTLEVSSPGLDRPLHGAAQFDRFAGHKVNIRLKLPVNGRRKFTGTLRGLREDAVVLESEEGELCLPLDDIDMARLVPEI
jgi:ribosome maturation factor RimP